MISHSGIGDLSTSLALSHHGAGHISRIGSRPAEEFARPTFASGAVLWRRPEGSPAGQGEGFTDAGLADGGATSARGTTGSEDMEIAVVHRPRYDDWSLPKYNSPIQVRRHRRKNDDCLYWYNMMSELEYLKKGLNTSPMLRPSTSNVSRKLIEGEYGMLESEWGCNPLRYYP